MDVADDSQELLAALERGKPEMHDPVAQDILDEVRRAALGVGSTPRQFGRFTVLERVAGGGMGVVYAAFDPKLSRKVAIKVLRDQGDARRRRLLREARTLARLSHPNVVAIHDVEHEGDAVFIAMEFIEGDSLRRWLRQPRLLERVVDVLVDAGQGLAAAHAQGVVHGDFKPGTAGGRKWLSSRVNSARVAVVPRRLQRPPAEGRAGARARRGAARAPIRARGLE
ncbi:MAG: protein kinase [Myxococcales bacterium]|nr:protein kinase [Myxococcales bacterium]